MEVPILQVMDQPLRTDSLADEPIIRIDSTPTMASPVPCPWGQPDPKRITHVQGIVLLLFGQPCSSSSGLIPRSISTTVASSFIPVFTSRHLEIDSRGTSPPLSWNRAHLVAHTALTSTMASVTDHYTASGLTLLMQTIRGQSSTTFFEPTRAKDSVSAADAHGYQHRIEKTGITQLTGFYGCGYDIVIPIPGTRKTRCFVLWVENPVANLEVNRQAVLKGSCGGASPPSDGVDGE
ncbi:hypothetical protein C8Q79DRAFT_996123 [Trametes meyenii]|nr:hypothetical protein C8Q79DRAFT_996123 [Trametes meyenii]